MNFIVTTTINKKTQALEKYENLKDWALIVIGDKKTPKMKLKNGIFISYQDQEKMNYGFLKKLPWNCIQRRNVGFFYAIQNKAELIATIDDDNIPFENWGKNVKVGKNITDQSIISSKLNVVDILNHNIGDKKLLWHRGYPIQYLQKRNKQTEKKIKRKKFYIEVEAGLWNQEPDVDAICRINSGPFNSKFKRKNYVIDNNKYSPFNTQNTIFSRRIAPSMCLPHSIGRMDDIWAGYISQRIMRELNSYLYFTGPTVYQERNVHNLAKDLEDEMIGYKNNVSLLNFLDTIKFSKNDDVISMYEKIIHFLSSQPYINKEMTEFQKSWIKSIYKYY